MQHFWSIVVYMSLFLLLMAIITFFSEDGNIQEKKDKGTVFQNVPLGHKHEKSGFKNWTELFHFIPLGLNDCKELYENNTSLPVEFEQKFLKYNEKVKSIAQGTEGFSAQYRNELLVYIAVAKAPFVRTVCETGFNAGHSTLTWLEVNPNTHVYSFDIGLHEYAKTMADHINKLYPGRFNITWGDSTVTLPAFHRQHPEIKCDLIVIDGGHFLKVAQSDYDVFKYMANEDNIILLDNYPDRRLMKHGIGRPWEDAKQKGELVEVLSCMYSRGQGFSVGRLITSNFI